MDPEHCPEGLLAITDQVLVAVARSWLVLFCPKLIRPSSSSSITNTLPGTSRNILHGCICVFSLNAVERPDPGTGLTLSSTTTQVGAARVAQRYCSGSTYGSGSVCFWTFWIRNLFVWILPSSYQQAKKIKKKNIYFYCFVTYLWLFIFEECCRSTAEKD
jgi:hypothetical protein